MKGWKDASDSVNGSIRMGKWVGPTARRITPNMVIINPDGKIVYEGAIDSKATLIRLISSRRQLRQAALDESLAERRSAIQHAPVRLSVKYKSS